MLVLLRTFFAFILFGLYYFPSWCDLDWFYCIGKQLSVWRFCSIKIWLQTSSHFKHVIPISKCLELWIQIISKPIQVKFEIVCWVKLTMFSGEEAGTQTGYDAFIKALIPDFSAPPCTYARYLACQIFDGFGFLFSQPIFVLRSLRLDGNFSILEREVILFSLRDETETKVPHVCHHAAMVWYLLFDRSQNLFYPSNFTISFSPSLAAYKSYQFYDSALALCYRAIKHKRYLRYDGKWYQQRKRL